MGSGATPQGFLTPTADPPSPSWPMHRKPGMLPFLKRRQDHGDDEIRPRAARSQSRGPAPSERHGPLHRRHRSARDVARDRVAQSARRRENPVDRHRGGIVSTRRAGDLHRRGPEGGRSGLAAMRRAGAEQGWLRHGLSRASGAGRRRGASRRRSGRVRGRRHARAGARRGGTGAGGLRRPALRHRPRDRDGSRCAGGLGWRDEQHRVRLGNRRQGGDRGGIRQSRACHHADGGEQPDRGVLDRGARRAGRLRSGHRPLDALRQHPGRLAGEKPDRPAVQRETPRNSASSRRTSAAGSA